MALEFGVPVSSEYRVGVRLELGVPKTESLEFRRSVKAVGLVKSKNSERRNFGDDDASRMG